jgi:hypothetical protein
MRVGVAPSIAVLLNVLWGRLAGIRFGAAAWADTVAPAVSRGT